MDVCLVWCRTLCVLGGENASVCTKPVSASVRMMILFIVDIVRSMAVR